MTTHRNPIRTQSVSMLLRVLSLGLLGWLITAYQVAAQPRLVTETRDLLAQDLAAKIAGDPLSTVKYSAEFTAFLAIVDEVRASGTARAIPAKTIKVTNPAELKKAVRDLGGSGGRIMLAPGKYDGLVIHRQNPARPVLIQSSDPDNPAEFSAINVQDSSQYIFRHIKVARVLKPEEKLYTVYVRNTKTRMLAWLDSEFHGSLDNNHHNDGYAMFTRFSNGLVIQNCNFHDVFRGAIQTETDNIRVADNHIHDLRMDVLDRLINLDGKDKT